MRLRTLQQAAANSRVNTPAATGSITVKNFRFSFDFVISARSGTCEYCTNISP